jgi:hypothetical protein
MTVSLDGVAVSAPTFGSTTNWDTWALANVATSAAAGPHVIRLTATTSTGGPNLDRISIS